MKLLKKRLTICVIRTVLSVLVLIDAWTDTILLSKINQRLFKQSIEYVTKEVTVVLDLKTIENILKSNVDELLNEECVVPAENNKIVDEARVAFF